MKASDLRYIAAGLWRAAKDREQFERPARVRLAGYAAECAEWAREIESAGHHRPLSSQKLAV